MSDLQAIVLGFIQGATEYLPISSTAHLRIIPSLLGWGDPGAAFTAVIQWGTLLSALVYFRLDLYNILFGRRVESEESGPAHADSRVLAPILIGTIPIIVFGLLLKHQIEGPWRSLYVIGGSMIVFALLLAAAEASYRSERNITEITPVDGAAVGIGQAFALIPGASRSGVTIAAALFSGLERSTAARFSFLLSLPAIFLAGAKELWDYRHEIAASHMIRPMILATIVAFVVGWIAIDWLLKYLRTHPTYGFIVYRIIVGAAILALAAKGMIK